MRTAAPAHGACSQRERVVQRRLVTRSGAWCVLATSCYHNAARVPRCVIRQTPGYKYHVPRQSAWFGVFMFGTAAVAHCTQRVAGARAARRGRGGGRGVAPFGRGAAALAGRTADCSRADRKRVQTFQRARLLIHAITTDPTARLLGVLPNDEEVKAFGVERKGK